MITVGIDSLYARDYTNGIILSKLLFFIGLHNMVPVAYLKGGDRGDPPPRDL